MNNKIEQLRQELEELNNRLANESTIYSSSDYPKIAKRQKFLEEVIDINNELNRSITQREEAEQLCKSDDLEIIDLAKTELQELEIKIVGLENKLSNLLTPRDPNYSHNAIIEIRAGAGGDEAGLFTGELYRMYARYAEAHNLKVELLDESLSEAGGYKEIIFKINGDDAYGILRLESGVHRVQRVPETESQGRIHTSTVTVAVLPEAEEADLVINPNDLRIDVYRSSGNGGQSVNTTDSAVRITHLPTNTVVAIQDEKSQIKNKEKALTVLRSRLLQMKINEENAKRSAERRALIGSGERSEKIRTYNFPQDRITDHRINYSRSNMQAMLNGEFDDVIEELQKAEANLINNEST